MNNKKDFVLGGIYLACVLFTVGWHEQNYYYVMFSLLLFVVAIVYNDHLAITEGRHAP